MSFSNEIELFIKEFILDLAEKNVAVFAGAGMSRKAGYVDWVDLLRDIATQVGLIIDKEQHDLISVAQYHVNSNGRNGINRKILYEFTQDAESTDNHKILARLPITTFWTTNYDSLIEKAITESNKVPDVKFELEQLVTTRPKRDVVVYKMHGDANHPAHAILTKEQYEVYYKTHEPFITALSGDLISKTFLFIGFSFTDPNLDYVLSRLNIQFGKNNRDHYCFIKKQSQGNDDDETFQYNQRKQELRIRELQRYHIKALLIEDYDDITKILAEIESRFRKKTIFISGSAEEYGNWDRHQAQGFIHSLSKKIVTSDFRIINGFGWGVGSAVINGALEAVYERPDKYSEDQLIVKPFPQYATGGKDINLLWKEYRERMISLAGIAIFIFGNKNKDGEIISADGVHKEFKIAVENNVIPIPIASTGYMSEQIYKEIFESTTNYYEGIEEIIPTIKELASKDLTADKIINKVISIIKIINR